MHLNHYNSGLNMFKDKLFISTTLPYINSAPHGGHTFEFVLADVIARYYRITLGAKNVMLNVGTDEHGQKVFERAVELGMQPQEYCDMMSKKWVTFCSKFHISYDNFYRTSSQEHKQHALDYFKRMQMNGFVYEQNYTGLYCTGCESFKLKKDLIDGRCEQHPSMILEEVSEKNFFLKIHLLKEHCVPNDILVDDSLNNELHNLLNNVEDMSISRNAEKVSWGIKIPDTDQTMYVWCDAIQCYVHAAGYKASFKHTLPYEFMDWWKNSMIVCGKDNLRFQALFLPVILAATGLPAPTKVLVHGTILDETGAKMSKSEGNVIDPLEQLEKFGLNALRYYLVAGLNTFSNSKYSEDELIAKFNNDVVDGYGNLMARALHLIDIKGIQIEVRTATLADEIIDKFAKVKDEFESGNIKQAYASTKALVDWANNYITENKPYSSECQNPSEILNNIYYLLLLISPMYQIVMPESAEAIQTALRDKKKVILYKKIEKATSPAN